MSTVAVCAIFRNESIYLREWVEFHLAQGVSQFLLYENDSDDDWHTALAPYIDEGLVRVIPWYAPTGQLSAYADAIANHTDIATWMAFIDIDEFLYSPTGRTLPEVLGDYGEHAGVCVNWRVFGYGGHRDIPDNLVTSSYIQRAKQQDPINRHVKSIVRPDFVLPHVLDPHHFEPVPGRYCVNERGEPVSGPFNAPVTWDRLVVNHYISKSRAEATVKAATRRSDNGALRSLEFLLSEHFNDVVDFDVTDLYDRLLRRRLEHRGVEIPA